MEKPTLALRAWGKLGSIERVSPFGSGHINDTYLVEGAGGRYILQRINTNTFQDVDGLMQNIRLVTEFITEQTRQAGGDVGRESMRVIPCDDGELYHRDEEGSCWRVLSYIEGSVCLQKARNEQDLFECAAAFGRFQRQLGAFDASRLTETIPRFHDTPKRYQDFERAVQQDTMGRAAKVQREIEFVRQHKADCRYLFDLQQRGELPLRVTHNDTKLNNVLLDERTMKGLCVIDLDTVMPGLSAHDFGDTVRFGANDCREDEEDQSRVHFLPGLYRVCERGFLSQAGEVLTAREKEVLRWGAKLMTLECGMRFLTDYLQGDVYFKIARPDQNLDRARTQFTLVQQMEACWDELAPEESKL